MWKLKEFIDNGDRDAYESINEFINEKNIKDWNIEGYQVVRYEQFNSDRTYILIKYKEDTQ